jgi:hypothetical protein
LLLSDTLLVLPPVTLLLLLASPACLLLLLQPLHLNQQVNQRLVEALQQLPRITSSQLQLHVTGVTSYITMVMCISIFQALLLWLAVKLAGKRLQWSSCRLLPRLLLLLLPLLLISYQWLRRPWLLRPLLLRICICLLLLMMMHSQWLLVSLGRYVLHLLRVLCWPHAMRSLLLLLLLLLRVPHLGSAGLHVHSCWQHAISRASCVADSMHVWLLLLQPELIVLLYPAAVLLMLLVRAPMMLRQLLRW